MPYLWPTSLFPQRPRFAQLLERQWRHAIGNLQRDELIARQIAIQFDLTQRERQAQIATTQHNPRRTIALKRCVIDLEAAESPRDNPPYVTRATQIDRSVR